MEKSSEEDDQRLRARSVQPCPVAHWCPSDLRREFRAKLGGPIEAQSDTVGHRHVTAPLERCRAGRAQGRESHRTGAVIDARASERRLRESRTCPNKPNVVVQLLPLAIFIAVPGAVAKMIALAEELAAVLGHLLLCYTQAPAGTKRPSAPTSFCGGQIFRAQLSFPA